MTISLNRLSFKLHETDVQAKLSRKSESDRKSGSSRKSREAHVSANHEQQGGAGSRVTSEHAVEDEAGKPQQQR